MRREVNPCSSFSPSRRRLPLTRSTFFAAARRDRQWPSTASFLPSSPLGCSQPSRCFPPTCATRSRTSLASSLDDVPRPLLESQRPRTTGSPLERGRHGGRALAFDGLDGPVAPARGAALGGRFLRLPRPLPERAGRGRLRPVLEESRDGLEVAHELAELQLASLVVRAQDRAGVDGREHVLREIGLDGLAALP